MSWGMIAVVVSSFALDGCACGDCDGKREAELGATYGVRLRCGSTCRADLSSSAAQRLTERLPSGGEADRHAVGECRDVASKPDAKYATAAFGDPCCHAGGSACTHFYYYFVSESARQLCIAL
jgi:hypothetical protein